MMSTIQALMAGAVDLHVHASYESPPRRQNMLEVARDALAAGVEGWLFQRCTYFQRALLLAAALLLIKPGIYTDLMGAIDLKGFS